MAYKEMKTYILNGYEYFYDRYNKHWVLYPVDNLGNRIEWDKYDNPIEANYFYNKTDFNNFLKKTR
jgi:hypothetical protein